VHESVLRKWVKEFAADPGHAFPGHGQMRPEQLEIDRLRREVAKLKPERDILIKAAAYFAKQLKALRFRTPYEAIEELWKSKPDVFIVSPAHLMLGLNT
jgi:transposase-like protein